MSYVREVLANAKPLLVIVSRLPERLSAVRGSCSEVLAGVSEVLAHSIQVLTRSLAV